MSVYENMAFGLKLAKVGREGVDQRVRNAARILQIEHLLERKPKQLSGGQRQRVAIGRAIVRDPKVFLFDEPLSNLDAALRVQMRIEIAKLHHALDATMIYVTHDQVEAMTLADRIVVLNAGTVEQFGSPLELYHHPQNLFVAGFIGSPKMNFLPGEVEAVTDNALTLRLADGGALIAPGSRNGLQPGEKVTLGLRPEHLLEGGGGDAELKGRVVAVEHLGGETYVYVDHGEDAAADPQGGRRFQGAGRRRGHDRRAGAGVLSVRRAGRRRCPASRTPEVPPASGRRGYCCCGAVSPSGCSGAASPCRCLAGCRLGRLCGGPGRGLDARLQLQTKLGGGRLNRADDLLDRRSSARPRPPCGRPRRARPRARPAGRPSARLSRARSRAGCGPSRRPPRPGCRRQRPPAPPERAARPSRCSGSAFSPRSVSSSLLASPSWACSSAISAS